MRRIILLALVFVWGIAPAARGSESLTVAAKGAVLIDGESGRVLFAQNADEMLPEASCTKVMTALLALERCALDEEVTAGKNAYGVPGTSIYLSAPMINNYVKNKLIPRPTGKKYSRLQIAMLIMIVALKQVCMMEDIRIMLHAESEEEVQSLYARFCERQTQAIGEMLSRRGELAPAMDCAIFSSAYRAGCECLLHAEEDAPQQ